jgi:hypothetical protein
MDLVGYSETGFVSLAVCFCVDVDNCAKGFDPFLITTSVLQLAKPLSDCNQPLGTYTPTYQISHENRNIKNANLI